MKSALLLALFSTTSLAVTIAEINGNRFISPFQDKTVRDVQGLVTATSSSGFWIRSTTPDNDVRTSESLYVFSNTTVVTVGNVISLDGRVVSYRASPQHLYLTEITNPTNVRTISTGGRTTPLVLGSNSNLSPPTEQYTSLDNGGAFNLPNNSSQISTVNPILEPSKYGLDFWKSITGELVTIRNPVAVSKANRFGDTWVVGSWRITSRNARGGLTVMFDDANPEAILISNPLDGSSNPRTIVLGEQLAEITGIVTYARGSFRVLPRTAVRSVSSPSPALPPATTLKSSGRCNSISVADYNIENFSSNSENAEGRANHIVNYLGTPDLVFLQEVQDNNGPTNDNVVDANKTLDVLVSAISRLTTVKYEYVDIDPVDDQDGGQPGGNIRTAYLYNPAVVRLSFINPGSSTDAVQVLAGPRLSYNPGRINPSSPAWSSSRKPLAAQWTVVADRSTIFTVNLHMTAKSGSSPIQGDARPPVNNGVSQRNQQASIIASFVNEIQARDRNAAVIVGGDMNEFTFVQPLQTLLRQSGLVDIDEAANVPTTERYTYLFDMNAQAIDHIFVSQQISRRRPRVEHIHVNTWARLADQVSDHDPTVALVNVCGSA